MIFDTDADGGVRMSKLQLRIDGIKRKLLEDESFNGNGRERVKLYARMFQWSVFADRVDDEEFSRFARACDQDCRPEEFKPSYWP